MVTGTGFEPVNACVKGMWVNRFSNRPLALEEGFEPPTDRLTADCSTAELFKHFRMLVYITMQIHLLQPFFWKNAFFCIFYSNHLFLNKKNKILQCKILFVYTTMTPFFKFRYSNILIRSWNLSDFY